MSAQELEEKTDRTSTGKGPGMNDREEIRNKSKHRPGEPWTRPLAIATIVLAVATIVLAAAAVGAIWAQREDSQKLLSAQMSNDLSKEFDSTEMRCSRQRLAALVLSSKTTHDWRVLDFLDQVAMHVQRGDVRDEDVYQAFSYWLERWWLAMHEDVKNWRSQQGSQDYYEYLERLYRHMRDVDHSPAPSREEIQRFLGEEEALDTFGLCRRLS